MQNTKKLSNELESKIDVQVEDLKRMILDNYKDATADEMELDIFMKVKDIGKTSMEAYMKKKL